MDSVSVTSGSLNTDVDFVLVYFFRLLVQIWINDLTAITHSERYQTPLFSFCPFSCIVSGVASVKSSLAHNDKGPNLDVHSTATGSMDVDLRSFVH
jgi:hypothetical protein